MARRSQRPSPVIVGCFARAQEFGAPAFAIEGTGSHGAGLVRFLKRAEVVVYECERPRRRDRPRGKHELIDAALAARRLLAGEGLSLARGDGRREDLRLLLLERRGAVQARNAALNQPSAPVLPALSMDVSVWEHSPGSDSPRRRLACARAPRS
jgi:hypothetical protein